MYNFYDNIDVTSAIGSATKVISNTVDKYQHTIFTAIVTSTLFLITLAWNDVVQDAISIYYPRDTRQNIYGKIYYALIITIVVVLVQIYIFPYISS